MPLGLVQCSIVCCTKPPYCLYLIITWLLYHYYCCCSPEPLLWLSLLAGWPIRVHPSTCCRIPGLCLSLPRLFLCCQVNLNIPSAGLFSGCLAAGLSDSAHLLLSGAPDCTRPTCQDASMTWLQCCSLPYSRLALLVFLLFD